MNAIAMRPALLSGYADHQVDRPVAIPAFDGSQMLKASQIMEVIYRYQHKSNSNAGTENSRTDIGLLTGLSQVYVYVKNSQPVKMALPAFPFKSPNTKAKVLGRLPDKAEEFALAHLNGLCDAIADVYEHGAKLTIISDGIVYNGTVPFPVTRRVASHTHFFLQIS